MNNSLVSVIIPTFNTGSFLFKSIESVLKQSYTNFELIIVDDGSDTDLKRSLNDYAKDSRVQYIRKENSGVCDTRNFGADVSKGEYLCFLDADDLFLTDNLKEKLHFLEQHPEIPLVHANVEVIDACGLSTGLIYEGLEGQILTDLLLWQRTVIPAPSSIMITRNAFFEVGKWDRSFSTAADQDLFIRIAARYAVGHINQILTKYRVLSNSMSRNISVMEKDHIAVYHKANRCGLFKSRHFKQKCFSNLYLILAGSWFKDGHNKTRGLYFVIRSLLSYPPVGLKLIKKIIASK